MSDVNTREKEYLVIRRSGSVEPETPKGGVWKIAYADFMTAMMAFFLVMWLINATSETTKTGVANYFNPIKLSDGMHLPRKGLHDPEEGAPEGAEAEESDEAAETEEAAEQAQADEHAQGAAADAHAATETGPASSDAKEDAAEGDSGRATAKRARFTEDALFRDPYAVLAAIAAEAEGISSLAARGSGSGPGAGGRADGAERESYGDPFDPAAWDATAGLPAAEGQAPSPLGMTGTGSDEAATGAAPRPSRQAPSENHIGNGPADLRMAASAANEPSAVAGAADAGALRLQAEILETLEQAMVSTSMPNVTVENANGGVLISLADQVDFGMFAIGSAEPLPVTISVMEKIANLLEKMPGKVIIRGHTDGRPFRSQTYDNWRLSAARAHMAYHMLVRGGLDERRVWRIEGYADRDLKLPDDPDAAENRRIDILIQEDVRS